VEQIGLELSLERYSVISGLCRAAGRVFHRDGPTAMLQNSKYTQHYLNLMLLYQIRNVLTFFFQTFESWSTGVVSSHSSLEEEVYEENKSW